MAEHMLIMRLTDPGGRRFHIAGAFPVGVRQDQPGHDGAYHSPAGRQSAWATILPGWRSVPDGRLYAHQPRNGLLRRGAGDVGGFKPHGHGDGAGERHLHQLRPKPTTATSGGRECPRRPPMPWTGTGAIGRRPREGLPPIPMRASQSPPPSARSCPPIGRTPPVVPSTSSSLGAAGLPGTAGLRGPELGPRRLHGGVRRFRNHGPPLSVRLAA